MALVNPGSVIAWPSYSVWWLYPDVTPIRSRLAQRPKAHAVLKRPANFFCTFDVVKVVILAI